MGPFLNPKTKISSRIKFGQNLTPIRVAPNSNAKLITLKNTDLPLAIEFYPLKPLAARTWPHFIVSAGPSHRMSCPQNIPSWARQHFVDVHSEQFFLSSPWFERVVIQESLQLKARNNTLAFGLWPAHLQTELTMNVRQQLRRGTKCC